MNYMKARQVFLFIASVLTLLVLVAWLLWGGTAANPFLIVGNWDGSTPTVSNDTPTPTKSGVKHTTSGTFIENGHLTSVITYDGTKFSPRILVLNKGNNVRFVNTSTLTMQIQMTTTGATQTVKQFTQSTSVGKGGIYELSLAEPGTWNVLNLNASPKISAVISIQ
jgi:hypothetical protein